MKQLKKNKKKIKKVISRGFWSRSKVLEYKRVVREGIHILKSLEVLELL